MPPRPRNAIRNLTAAIADGEAIDWARASQNLGGTDSPAALAALRFAAGRANASLQSQGLATEVQRLESGAHLRAIVSAFLAFTTLQAILSSAVALISDVSSTGVPYAPVLAFIFVYLGAALVLVRRERFDARVIWLAGFFLAAAASACQVFLSYLPALFGNAAWARLWTSVLPECFLPAFLWGFLREFPRVRRFDRTARANSLGFLTSACLGSVLFLANLALPAAPSSASPPWSEAFAPLQRDHASGFFWLTLSVLLICAPLVALFKTDLENSVEVHRVRWFLGAVALGVLPMFVSVVADAVWPEFSRATDTQRGIVWSTWILYGFLLLVPVATAYAILSQRALDLRTALRGASRVALARTTISALALVPLLLLVRFLAQHSGATLGTLGNDSDVLVLVTLGLLGLGLLGLRQRLVRLAESRWVGHRSGIREVLETASSDLLAARDLRALDRAIEAGAAALIGADSASILLTRPSKGHYAAIRPGHRDLPATSALVQVIAAVKGPVHTSPDYADSIFRILPVADRKWLAETGAAVVTSIPDSAGMIRGLLLVGPSRSGGPFLPEEVDLAGVLASTASIALERFDWGASSEHQFPEAVLPAGQCLRCRKVVARTAGRCDCGRAFEPAPLPFELAGKFRLKSILGNGGMGIVYLATDLELDRFVALKTLPQLRSSALLRLRREARSMASVSHPNLATIFGLETFDNLPVLVMEYLPGGTLADKVRAPMSVESTLQIAKDVAGGLVELHARGLLHRDIKPSNIAFGNGGTAKLLDFGLAKVAEAADVYARTPSQQRARSAEQAITPLSHAVGTLVFLSPEALRGEPASEAQDLWAFHMVLWEMLAGRHPCQDLPHNEALRLLARGAVPDIRLHRPACPAPLATLLAQGLAPDPLARAKTASEVYPTLQRLASGFEPFFKS